MHFMNDSLLTSLPHKEVRIPYNRTILKNIIVFGVIPCYSIQAMS
jgi:hypothetical protein